MSTVINYDPPVINPTTKHFVTVSWPLCELHEFDALVNTKLNDGFLLHGNPVIDKGNIFQCMYKEVLPMLGFCSTQHINFNQSLELTEQFKPVTLS